MTPNPPDHDFPKAIGGPATGALLHLGYTRMEQLTKMTEEQLLSIHGVGPKAVRALKSALAEQGLSLAQAQDPGFPKLAAPAVRALTGAGYTRLEQLMQVTEAELKALHGMGPNALKTLKEALAEKGWALKE
jgi:DNA-directed RNA polymerase alpha subunit